MHRSSALEAGEGVRAFLLLVVEDIEFQGQMYPFKVIEGLREVLGWGELPWDGFFLDDVVYFDKACLPPTAVSQLVVLHDKIKGIETFRRAVAFFCEVAGPKWTLVTLLTQSPALPKSN